MLHHCYRQLVRLFAFNRRQPIQRPDDSRTHQRFKIVILFNRKEPIHHSMETTRPGVRPHVCIGGGTDCRRHFIQLVQFAVQGLDNFRELVHSINIARFKRQLVFTTFCHSDMPRILFVFLIERHKPETHPAKRPLPVEVPRHIPLVTIRRLVTLIRTEILGQLPPLDNFVAREAHCPLHTRILKCHENALPTQPVAGDGHQRKKAVKVCAVVLGCRIDKPVGNLSASVEHGFNHRTIRRHVWHYHGDVREGHALLSLRFSILIFLPHGTEDRIVHHLDFTSNSRRPNDLHGCVLLCFFDCGGIRAYARQVGLQSYQNRIALWLVENSLVLIYRIPKCFLERQTQFLDCLVHI